MKLGLSFHETWVPHPKAAVTLIIGPHAESTMYVFVSDPPLLEA